jgi:hypothetical protein
MELNEAIEILKKFQSQFYSAPTKSIEIKITNDESDALRFLLNFAISSQDAEMPKKKDYQEHSYYELYDKWLAYHTKKMAEKDKQMRSVAEIKEAIKKIHNNNNLSYSYREDVISVLDWVLGAEIFDGLQDE